MAWIEPLPNPDQQLHPGEDLRCGAGQREPVGEVIIAVKPTL